MQAFVLHFPIVLSMWDSLNLMNMQPKYFLLAESSFHKTSVFIWGLLFILLCKFSVPTDPNISHLVLILEIKGHKVGLIFADEMS